MDPIVSPADHRVLSHPAASPFGAERVSPVACLQACRRSNRASFPFSASCDAAKHPPV